MSSLINTANRSQLKSLLLNLHRDSKPLWGKMNAQQMAEHLVDAIQYTNGKLTGTCARPANEALKGKMRGIYTDFPFPKNVILGTVPENNCYDDIPAAVNQLMMELADFDGYFKTPGATAVHGGFGDLTYDEWIIWHSKHFTHHLQQFGLLPE